MISVDEALEKVLLAAAMRGSLPTEPVPLRKASGRVLRETIVADGDMPPFTRSAMDGYALRASDVRETPALLEVIEEIPAGRSPVRAIGFGQAAKIMTGAALPEGADSVQMVEKTSFVEPGRIRIDEPVEPGTHVRSAGEDLRKGDELVRDGSWLDAVHIALLAAAGHARVSVSRRPVVAIIPTGDELVPVESRPEGAQIRETNGQTLCALVRRSGGEPDLFPIAQDTLDDLETAIAYTLRRADIVLLSGGVSMGEYDLVGQALIRLRCRLHFDRVAIQPGKPLWFGVGPGEDGPLVFGLPGNPVSTLVDYLVFVRPVLLSLMACTQTTDPMVVARLSDPVHRKPGRRAYLPALMEPSDGGMSVRLVHSKGSADMVALSRANALAIFPEETGTFEAGVSVNVLPLGNLTR